mgnify:CR=1 FL=1
MKPTTWRNVIDVAILGIPHKVRSINVSSRYETVDGKAQLGIYSYAERIGTVCMGVVTLCEPNRSSRTTNKHINYLRWKADEWNNRTR